MDDVEFPNFSHEDKYDEEEDFDLLSNCFDVDMADTNVNDEKKKTEKNCKCRICYMSFSDNYKLKQHEKAHIEAGELMPRDLEEELKKPVKDKKILLENATEKHKRTQSDELSRVRIKGKASRRSQLTTDGSLDDSGESPNISQYVEHEDPLVSSTEVPVEFTCQICEKTFRDRYHRKRHELIHIKAGELDLNAPEPDEEERLRKKDKTCPICKKEFGTKYKLHRHLKVHGVKPERTKKMCQQCGKAFDDDWKLQRHEKCHGIIGKLTKMSDEKFICQICNKDFLDRYKLKRHEKYHFKYNEEKNKTLKKSSLKEIHDQNLGEMYERLKNFFKYESAVLRQNGKVGLKYTCLNCQPVKKELICPINPIKLLGNHVRSEHPAVAAKYDQAMDEYPK